VRITRPRHPLRGQRLRVLGRMRRHGRAELLLVLPDGSKSLIPAAWTDLHEPTRGGAAGAGTLGSLADLLAAHELIGALLARVADSSDAQQAARQSSCEEDNRAACAAKSDAGPGAGATHHTDRRTSSAAGRHGGRVAGRADRQGRDRRGAHGGGR
jgi:hypothetical protein